MESTVSYIRHRLKVAGGERELFTPEALSLIHAYSRGIPRLINVICDNSLFESFLVKKEIADAEIVESVATDLGLEKVADGSGAMKIDPRSHPVLTPEGLNEEEMTSLDLLDEGKTD